MMVRTLNLLLLVALGARPVLAAETGFQPEVQVSAATRLDWQFVVSGFGPGSARLPADYDSRQQRYQLYVPPTYHDKQAWPLVVFISPGDDPLGWRYWQKVCEDGQLLFCAAYAAGNQCPVGQRTRIVLDMLDDVRRHYQIDPDRTYLSGFSGGGRMACSVGFALPEYVGGIVPICGTNPLHPLAYLRHRAQDRLSVALVTGQADFNRKENEDYMAPLCHDLGVRSKLWVVPQLGHGVPGPAVLAEVVKWLEDDLPRRRADGKALPSLTVSHEQTPTAFQQAARLVEAAEKELKRPERTWRGVALLQGATTRFEKLAPAERSRRMLDTIQKDPKKSALLAEQKGEDDSRRLAAQARALERFGQRRRAMQAWEELAKLKLSTSDGKKATGEARRLADAIAAAPKRPYLGLSFARDSNTVAQVAADGPAAKAGLKVGDVLLKIGPAKIETLAELVKALEHLKPGDKVKLEARREGKTLEVMLEIGGRPPPGDE